VDLSPFSIIPNSLKKKKKKLKKKKKKKKKEKERRSFLNYPWIIGPMNFPNG
jgi:hypothetical protein